ncbi:MAG: methyltransferase domain-containing protein [Chloroflexia bacterium]
MKVPDDIEAELAARIAPWLEHMRWRRDFDSWRERRLHQEHYQEEHLAHVRAVCPSPAGRTVLDLGAGMGGFAVAMAWEGAHVFALEYHEDYCQITRLRGRRYGLDLPIVRAAGEALPFPADSFDWVCCWDVLEHVQNPQAVLAEAYRVLHPGGVLLLTVMNRWAFYDPHYHLPGINWLPRPWAEALIRRLGRGKGRAAFSDRQALSEMHYFTWGTFCRLAEAIGFQVEDVGERRLRSGLFPSRRPWRRRLRTVLRALSLERPAYFLARAFLLPVFEVALWKR